MPSTRNHRLPANILQADLDCITALKAIEGYAPSNPPTPSPPSPNSRPA